MDSKALINIGLMSALVLALGFFILAMSSF